MGLVADGRLDLKPLISHVSPFAEAAALFAQVDRQPDEVLQAVLRFEES
jgi:threonine dehydrogenase-like Zn-dependent dehydrogenase